MASLRPENRGQKARSGLALAILAALALPGCGATLAGADAEEAGAPPPRVTVLFPEVAEAEVRTDRYDGHVALVRGGRVYGSTGDDMPGQVVGMAAGLAIAPSGPHMLRVGVVGFGTGISAGVALAAGSRVVDVFEQDADLVRAGEALAGRSGLTYQEGVPLHPSLRIVGPEQARTERLARYDVLVSPPATSAIAGPARLVTVERLEGLVALLGSDGLLVHHLPAYELSPDAYRRLLRTFAHTFSHLLVLAAGPQSGDTFVVCSQQPLRLRPRALEAIDRAPSLAELREAAGLVGPMDLAARVLFSSREEVLAFAEGARACTEADPLAEEDAPSRPPMPPPGAPEADREAWEEAMETHRARFERMDLLRQRMLGLDWTYGAVCPDGIYSDGCLLADVGADAEGAGVLGELSLSLMAVGRFVEARLTVESAAELALPPPLEEASRVLRLLLEEMPDLSSVLPDALGAAREAAAAGACDEARSAAEAAAAGGAAAEAETRIAAAWVVATCGPEDPEAMGEVARLLAPLADERSLAARYPALLYLRARAAMVRGRYAEATWTMQAFLRAVGRQAPPAPSAEPPETPPAEPPAEGEDQTKAGT